MDRCSAAMSSAYRGVCLHRVSKRWEAHVWMKTPELEGRRRRGRQCYVGCYSDEETAARAYDLAALKLHSTNARTNFPAWEYDSYIQEMACVTAEMWLKRLRAIVTYHGEECSSDESDSDEWDDNVTYCDGFDDL